MATTTNMSRTVMLAKVVRYVWCGIVTVFTIIAAAVLVLALYAPPTMVIPGPDQGAGGRPALPLPGGTEESFEPHISIDPSNVDHIVVAAEYGRRFGRAGTGIYEWTSVDGGNSWNGQDVPAAKFPGIFAADPATGVGTSGEVYIVSMFQNRAVPNSPFALQLWLLTGGNVKTRVEGGIAVARAAGPGHAIMPPVVIGGTEKGSDPGDKTWLTVDNSPASTYRGSVYVSWATIDRKNASSGMTSIGLLFVYSRDAGTTFSVPEYVTHHGYGVQLVVRPNGTLDAIYLSDDRKAVLHQQSSNGGLSFTPATVVAPQDPDTLRGFPTLAVSASGALLACWPENRKNVKTHVVCETSEDGLAWSHLIDVVPNRSEGTIIAYPAAAALGTDWWVLAYCTDADTTRVVLYRSIDHGVSFSSYATLATRRFGARSFCTGVGHEAACRFNPFIRDFVPGDYVGLAASGHRLAAAFVLPRNDDPVGFANVYAAVLDIPGESGTSAIVH